MRCVCVVGGVGGISYRTVRTAFSLAIKNGRTEEQFFQALCLRNRKALTSTRNPDQQSAPGTNAVSGFCFDELHSTLLTWLPSPPDDESPLLGRILTPAFPPSLRAPLPPAPACVVGYFLSEFLSHRAMCEALISLYMRLAPPPD